MATHIANIRPHRPKLLWATAGTGAMVLNGDGFCAVVSPVLYAGSAPKWKMYVTLVSEECGNIQAEYGGCIPKAGQNIVECFLFSRSV